MLLFNGFAVPLSDASINVDSFAISGGAHEPGVNFDQGGANDASRFKQFSPRRNAAFHEKMQAGCVHPFAEVGKKYNARWVAITELHVHGVGGGFAERSGGNHRK